MDFNPFYTNKRRRRIKLFFNPVSGEANHSPIGLADVVKELEAWKFIPEVCVLSMDSDLPKMVQESLTSGIRLFVACGGDGTVSSVAKAVAGKPATMGIIPMGTKNNVALSLGIPEDLTASVAILRTGRRIRTDTGTVLCGNTETPFVEICSVGLMSSLFSSSDDIQHGHLEKVGDFLAKFASCAPSRIKMLLDGRQEIITTGHVVLVTNMPYIGGHYQVGVKNAYRDGYLDLLLCCGNSKLNLIGCAITGSASVQGTVDPRIQRYRAKKAEIDTEPPMPVMADGRDLGKGAVHVEVHHHSLAVMAPKTPLTGQEKTEAKK